MNIPNIASASVLPKLQGILTEDIEALQGMLRSRTEDSKMYGLIDSLIFAKEKMLKMLPATEGMNEIPTTGQRMGLSGYRSKNSTEVKDQVLMVGILLDIESTQHEFVKAAAINKGLPNDLQDVLKKVARMYADIVEQLGRSKKTQQLGTIVV